MPKELVLVHVIFRHGERTPDSIWVYPKEESFVNKEFPPYGSGQLINEGKRTMYNLGFILKERYKHLLKSYKPGLIEARSTGVDRTKVSLQLVLASLVQPADEMIWNNQLNWLPMPFHSTPMSSDTLLGPFFNVDFSRQFNNNIADGSLDESMTEMFQSIIPEVEKHTGLTIRSSKQFWGLAEHIKAEEIYGIKLQDWCKTDLLQRVREVALLHYKIIMAKKDNLKFLLGEFLNKILEDTNKSIEEKSKVKMHIYSAHEMNVVGFLTFLKIWQPHMPTYGACIALEVFKSTDPIGNIYHELKVAYRRGKYENFEYLEFSNGIDFLKLENFAESVNELNSEDVQMNSIIV